MSSDAVATVLLAGSDSLGRQALQLGVRYPKVCVLEDRSTTPARIRSLLWDRRIPPADFARMVWSELQRRRGSDPVPWGLPQIRSNEELLRRLTKEQTRRVVLFRAGLIISPGLLRIGIPIVNIHCASLPEFGGLNAVRRALVAGRHEQNATLHRVTSRIDQGEVLDEEPYRLDPAAPYRVNEDRAYAAGLRLLQRTLSGEHFAS